jgi:hypothetical protein
VSVIERIELRVFVPRPLADDMEACHLALSGLLDDSRDELSRRGMTQYDDPDHHMTAYAFAVKRDPDGLVRHSEPVSSALPHWADARMYVLDIPVVPRG